MNYKRSFLGIPLLRRRNRRWLVAVYWGIILLVAVLFAALLKVNPKSVYFVRLVIIWICIFIKTPYLHVGLGSWFWEYPERLPNEFDRLRTLFDTASREEQKKYPPSDELEQKQWSKAYQNSYGMICLMVLIAFTAHIYGSIPNAVYVREPLFLLMAVVIFNLPQTFLLCVVPDMEEPQ